MSNTKHTPGPWEYVDRCDNRGNPVGFSVWPDLERPYSNSPRGNQICTTPDCYSTEALANARLIAAAPQMLGALKEAREYILKVSEATHHAENDYADYDLLDAVETAIAAAEGEE